MSKVLDLLRFLRIKQPKEQEWLLWLHGSPGSDQIGRRVDIDGRTGKVVDGTVLKILVEWD